MTLQICNYQKTSAIKISALTQAIHFSSLTVLKILNAVNAGVELRLANPLTTAASVFFFSWEELYLFRRRIFSRPYQTGDFSDARSNFTSAPGASQTSAETVKLTRSFKTSHKDHFFIEIYTSCWINKLSIDVWFVRIGQCLAEIQLFKNLESERANKSKYWEIRL